MRYGEQNIDFVSYPFFHFFLRFFLTGEGQDNTGEGKNRTQSSSKKDKEDA